MWISQQKRSISHIKTIGEREKVSCQWSRIPSYAIVHQCLLRVRDPCRVSGNASITNANHSCCLLCYRQTKEEHSISKNKYLFFFLKIYTVINNRIKHVGYNKQFVNFLYAIFRLAPSFTNGKQR